MRAAARTARAVPAALHLYFNIRYALLSLLRVRESDRRDLRVRHPVRVAPTLTTCSVGRSWPLHGHFCESYECLSWNQKGRRQIYALPVPRRELGAMTEPRPSQPRERETSRVRAGSGSRRRRSKEAYSIWTSSRSTQLSLQHKSSASSGSCVVRAFFVEERWKQRSSQRLAVHGPSGCSRSAMTGSAGTGFVPLHSALIVGGAVARSVASRLVDATRPQRALGELHASAPAHNSRGERGHGRESWGGL